MEADMIMMFRKHLDRHTTMHGMQRASFDFKLALWWHDHYEPKDQLLFRTMLYTLYQHDRQDLQHPGIVDTSAAPYPER